MAYSIVEGFTPDQTERAVELFWQAFKGKLAPVMKPEAKAIAFFNRVVDASHAISAISDDGRLNGIAGYKTGEGAFIGGNLRDIIAEYGAFGGIWRGLVLSLLERSLQSGTLLMDGIFVSEAARGQGVGTALLAAIKTKAVQLNCSRVRLDVIDANPRAQALYERCGFVPLGTYSIGPLKHIFGFQKATTMVWKAEK